MTRKRVLIADDDETVRRLLRTTFADEAYEVVEAADGDQALEQLEQSSPDIVVLDWKMPKRHGAFVLDELKERYPRLPVIVLTAEGRQTQRAVAESLRADAFITKPFSPRELLETVERLLGGRPTG
ncbi:MAG: response regulator [Actinomycetota bacterium]|nr:response regulator [Actinomycetota bacterium]